MSTTELKTTENEAFIMLLWGLINDMVNGHTGLLRTVANRLDPTIEDRVHGNLKEFLEGQVTTLQNKRGRILKEIIEMVGEEQWINVIKENLASGFKIESHLWKKTGECELY